MSLLANNLLFNLLHLGEEGVEDLGECLDPHSRTICATGIEVSTKNGDAMAMKSLEMLSSFEPGHIVLPGQSFMPPPTPGATHPRSGVQHHHH